jgi:hypothetical protein
MSISPTTTTTTCSNIVVLIINELITKEDMYGECHFPIKFVRLTIINGIQYLCIRDLIMAACLMNQTEANKLWTKLSDHKKNEIQPYILYFKFPPNEELAERSDQHLVITFIGAMKLFILLSEFILEENMSCMVQILIKIFIGDPTPIQSILLAHQSSSYLDKKEIEPEQYTMPTFTCNAHPKSRIIDEMEKKQKHDVMFRWEKYVSNIQEQILDLEDKRANIQTLKLKNLLKFNDLMTLYEPKWIDYSNLKSQLANILQTIILEKK